MPHPKIKIYLVERIHKDQTTLIVATRSIRAAHNVALEFGQIKEPDLNYKATTRRLQTADSILLYDKSRFMSDTEAKYSPLGDVVRITRMALIG